MARILCVDDEPHVVTLKCAILESAGHSVTACTSARDAIEKLRHNAYDAVVTDWRLGDANGRAVVQAAKDHSSMPVVVVSGYVAEAFQAAEPLADLYLEKPVNPEELVTIVNELLSTSEPATSHSSFCRFAPNRPRSFPSARFYCSCCLRLGLLGPRRLTALPV